MLNSAFLAVLSFTPWVSVLIAALLLIHKSKAPLAARFYRGAWLLLALRCALPLTFSLPSFEAPIQVQLPLPQTGFFLAAPAAGTAMAGEAVQGGGQMSLISVGAVVWAVGAVCFLLWRFGSYALFTAQLRKSRMPVTNQALLTVRSAVWGKAVPLYGTPLLGSPALVGIFRHEVYLPMAKMSPDTLRIVLEHERCHAKRGDIAAKVLLCLAQAVCWVNPLVWLMCRTAEHDMECACDEVMLYEKSTAYRQHYGTIILSTLHAGRKAPAFSTSFCGSPHALKARFTAMFEKRNKKTARMLLCVLMLLLFSASVLIACTAMPVQSSETPPESEPAALEVTSQLPQSQPDYSGFAAPVDFTNFWAKDSGVVLEAVPSAQVMAAAAGTVRAVSDAALLQAYGKMIAIEHGFELVTYYGYLGEISVQPGDMVTQGQAIGLPGAVDKPEQTGVFFALKNGETWAALKTTQVTQPQSEQGFIAPLAVAAKNSVLFGEGGHRGVDFLAEQGTPIVAMQSGTVLESFFHWSLGNTVLIDHGNGYTTRYAHMSSLLVKEGDTVEQGRQIGTVGSTGNSTGNNLHLEMTYQGELIDPLTCMTPAKPAISFS